jgi:hypothetical protein
MAGQILDDASIALVKAANLSISLEAIEEIIFEEDSSEFYYNKVYQHPEWPGGASGVTIALGYDLGYATAEKIKADFSGKVSDESLMQMISCAGITGASAYHKMLAVKASVVVPWSAALAVFLNRDMPTWIRTVDTVLPNTDKLGPMCRGMLVSLAYNRGASFNNAGDRYREMRAIKADMAAMHFADIPNQFRSMARLWTGGVHARRLREATLFEKGLTEMKGPST